MNQTVIKKRDGLWNVYDSNCQEYAFKRDRSLEEIEEFIISQEVDLVRSRVKHEFGRIREGDMSYFKTEAQIDNKWIGNESWFCNYCYRDVRIGQKCRCGRTREDMNDHHTWDKINKELNM